MIAIKVKVPKPQDFCLICNVSAYRNLFSPKGALKDFLSVKSPFRPLGAHLQL